MGANDGANSGAKGPAGLEAMASELEWLEKLLGENEDWRALQQLSAREAQGESLTSIDGQRLKSVLFAALADSRFFMRREQVLTEMAAAKASCESGRANVSPIEADAVPADDLRRIRGISAIIARRLNAIGVTTFDQIAAWSAADVAFASKTLELGRAISRENWIEQAALLVRPRVRSEPGIAVAAQQPALQPVLSQVQRRQS
jgi:predicted flap endonuclease-1-like 5' DNA nuclease